MRKNLHPILFLLCLLILYIPFSVTALGTETLITTGTADSSQLNPSTWGNYIVWEDQQGGTNSIILYNVTSGEEQRISSHSGYAHSPRIQGNYVVWYENTGTGSDILVFDIISNTSVVVTSSLSEKLNPVIFGNKIIWQEYIDTDGIYPYYDLQLYDIDNPSQVTNITPHAGTPGIDSSSHEYPSIWGDTVVWQEWDDALMTYEIFTNNTISGNLTQISDDGGVGSMKFHPVISGDTILWSDYRNGDADIFADAVIPAGNLDITPYTPSIQEMPVVFGDSVVWLDDRDHEGSFYQIGLKNLTTTLETYPVTPSSHIRLSSAISPSPSPLSLYNNRIVWEDDRVPGGNADIYMYTDGISVTCPVAGFTQNITTGELGEVVQFLDTSKPSPSHWTWDFGDGSTAHSQNPTHTYTTSGVFAVTLTAGTPYCRNSTGISSSHNVSIGSPPLVSFSGSPREGMVPLTVIFSESSSGIPTAWNWSFGDGEFSENPAPTHTYTAGGAYTVTLNATNAYGTGTLSKTAYITVSTGAHEFAFTNISGISVQPVNSSPCLVYEKASLPQYTLSPDKTILVSNPPVTFGWQNITFVSGTGAGFAEDPATIQGSLSYTILQTKDIMPAGFSDRVGNNVQVNSRLNITSYRYPGWFITDIWEGTTSSDNYNCQIIYTRSNFATMNGAYTIDTIRSNLTVPEDMTLNVSVGSDWVTGSEGLDWGRQHTFVLATGTDSDGNLNGIVFPSRFIFNDTSEHLEYFEIDIPAQYAYFNKFVLAKLSGSGNVFQMVTLTVASYISPVSDSGGTYIPADVQYTPAPEVKPTALPDIGKTAKIYSNNKGVITQATTLQSLDGLATLFVGEGIVAKNVTGAALSSITINSVPAGSVSGFSNSAEFTYAGMAYELLPEGSSFSPSVPLNFSAPQVPWGQTYVVRTFDHVTGVWQEVPTAYNPETGIVTAQLSHFCFVALFARTETPEPSTAATIIPTPTITNAPLPPSAISTFAGMLIWIADLVAKNAMIVAGLVILVVALLLYGRKRRRDRIMHQ